MTRSNSQDRWWRCLEELEHPDIYAKRNAGEFDPEKAKRGLLDRRSALQLMAAATAMTTAGCERPSRIVPYVRMPERLVPGEPAYFATALSMNGFAAPAVVTSYAGRPTKIEGNLESSGSGGATDAFSQCELLSLYDPGRSKAVTRKGQIATWDDVLSAIAERLPRWRQSHGEGLRLLTGAVTSPTLADKINGVIAALPNARWHRWQPVNSDNTRKGAEIAFGQRLDPVYRLENARLILAIDDDFLGPGPRQVIHGAGFSNARRARQGSDTFARLYAVEPVLTATGAKADHRLAVRRSGIAAVLSAVAHELGASVASAELQPDAKSFASAVARDLAAYKSNALVMVGEAQPPEVHWIGHWINDHIGARGHTVDLIEPIEANPVDHADSLRDLVQNMNAGKVDSLFIVDASPLYTAPADLDFGAALKRVPLSLRLGVYEDETSGVCNYHVPALHALESWGDLTAPNGEASIMQPLIAPLYGGRSPYELIAALLGQQSADAHDAVLNYWRQRLKPSDFDAWWRRTLQKGRIDETSAAVVARGQIKPPPSFTSPAKPRFEVSFFPDAAVWDGAYSENAWCQETPRPLTKLVWGNAALMSPDDAAGLKLSDGDLIRLTVEGAAIELPALRTPGVSKGTIALNLGYGRGFGEIGRGVGTNVYPLRRAKSLWSVAADAANADGHGAFYSTQTHKSTDGKDIIRSMPHDVFAKLRPRNETTPASLYPQAPQPQSQYAWAMVIDETACIGCNACVSACQAENNIPVVGPEEIARGRDMHWLRVDVYHRGDPANPQAAFQPVPCMHCEKAPCEPMCPVEASVHDTEGLNVQVYNRCIGTRFCQANCPYKVRRFNFFGYGDGQEYANLGAPVLQAVHNPDVSVRARGVMEKCTYCIQRISRARRQAEKENRSIRDGEVVTACQQACPADAIVFGNRNDNASAVARSKAEPHDYALLGELGTRPRTTYLAQVTNPNPDLEPKS